MTAAIDLARQQPAELNIIVRRATGCASAVVDAWQIHPLSYDRTSPVSAGVYRLAGTATSDGEAVPWSLVLKVLRSPAGSVMPNGTVIPRDVPDDPAIFGYWKREALAYQSGLLDELPAGLAAPRCYAVIRHDDASLWLWLEEVVGPGGDCWTPERYRLAAHHLGRFNGAYLAGRQLPTAPGLGKGWLRSFLDLPGVAMMRGIRQAGAWEHPVLRDRVPCSLRARVLQLWDDRAALLAALDGLPHTFCHRDAFRPNLFAGKGTDGQEQTVAIDWAFAGQGPVGEEIAPLIAMRPCGSAEEYEPWDLEMPVVEGYVQGLQEAGWSADPAIVRFGYTATVALRYAFMSVAEMLCDAGDEAHHAEVERRRGQSIERVLERQAALTLFLMERADEARTLLTHLPRSATVEPAVPCDAGA